MKENIPAHPLGILNHRARNWSSQVENTEIVTPSEIQGLQRFQGYMITEGRVIKIKLQDPGEQRVLVEPIEVITPSTAFANREPDNNPVAVTVHVVQGELPLPTDDPPPPPYNEEEFQKAQETLEPGKKPVRRGHNPLAPKKGRKKPPGQMALESKVSLIA